MTPGTKLDSRSELFVFLVFYFCFCFEATLTATNSTVATS